MLNTLVLRFCFVALLLVHFTHANTNPDSLYTAYRNTSELGKKLDLAYRISRDPVKFRLSTQLLFKLLQENSSEKNYISRGRICIVIGDVYLSYNIDSAIYYYNRSLQTFKKTDSVYYNKAKVGLAAALVEKGDFNSALKLNFEALAYFKRVNDSAKIFNTLGNIGNLYTSSKNYNQAILFSEEALKYSHKSKSPTGEATALNNIGTVLGIKGEFDSALVYFERTKTIYTKAGDKHGELNAQNNICACISGKNDIKNAIACFSKLADMQKKLNDNIGLISSYINLASLHNSDGNYRESVYLLEYLLTSEKIKKAIEVDAYIDIYTVLTDSYKKMKRYNDAFFALEKYHLYHDSLFNNSKREKIQELSSKYELEKKNRELAQKDQKLTTALNEKLAAEIQLKDRNLLIIVLLASLLILVFVSIIIVQRNKTKIEKEKNKAVIAEKDKGVMAIIDTQEKERAAIAKELHDGVGNNLLALQMLWNTIYSEGEQHKNWQEIHVRLKEITDEVRNVSHQMMPKVLSEFGIAPALQDMLEKTLHYSAITYTFETHNLDQRYDQKIELTVFRIVQELISNVIKHSAASSVTVQVHHTLQHLIILVEDNGKGMNDTKQNNGIGLAGIKSRLAVCNGEISINTVPTSGTSISIRIPV